MKRCALCLLRYGGVTLNYKLVWEEDFNDEGLPNETYFNITESGSGFGNNEDQYYTKRLKNLYVKDSILKITAYKEDYEHRSYTSGKIDTFGKVQFGYGKVEIRAKLPQGRGTWPALWFLSDSIRKGTRWPDCGEIDLMENIGRNPGEIHFSLHSKTYNHKINTQITYFKTIPGILEGFHVYKMIWEEDFISFYVDDIHYVTFRKGENGRDASKDGWPFQPPYSLLMNFAVGGNWGGKVDDSIFPQTFEIDYVRYYEKVSE